MEKYIVSYIRKIISSKTSYSLTIPKEIVKRQGLENSRVRIIELENCIVIEKIS